MIPPYSLFSERNTSLRKLNLSYTKIQPHGADYMVRALEKNTTLQVLRLRCNNLRNSPYPETHYLTGGSMLGRCLTANAGLLKLDISNTCINDISIEELVGCLKSDKTTLKRLFIGGNGFVTSKGITILAQSLEHNKILVELNLRMGKVENQGAKALGAALEKNQTLEILNLSFNDIEDPGATTLIKSLEHNSTLKRLLLVANMIKDETAAAVEKMLKKNKGLILLDLSAHRFGVEGLKAVISGLKENTTLVRLELESTSCYFLREDVVLPSDSRAHFHKEKDDF